MALSSPDERRRSDKLNEYRFGSISVTLKGRAVVLCKPLRGSPDCGPCPIVLFDPVPGGSPNRR